MAFLLILCFATAGEAGDYRVRRKTQHYVVDAGINRNPPVMGENTIRIEIRDAGGKTLTGARVWELDGPTPILKTSKMEPT